VHHGDPGLAWFKLSLKFRETRTDVLAENGGFYYRSYVDIYRRFLVRQKDEPVYPGV